MHGATGADLERVKREIEEVIGIDCSHAICASAKQVLHTQLVICLSCSPCVMTAVPSGFEQYGYIHSTMVRLQRCLYSNFHGSQPNLHLYRAQL